MLFLVAFPQRGRVEERKDLLPVEVCALTGLKKKCSFSAKNKTIFVKPTEPMKPPDALRYCDLMLAVLRAWREIGYHFEPGWTLEVRTSKNHAVDCSLH